MSTHSTSSSEQAKTCANLLFALFIYYSDADGKLGAREVQCLHQLLEKLDWCENAEVRLGLEDLRLRYSELWKNYQNDAFVHELPALTARLATLLKGASHPDVLIAGLRAFLDRFCLDSSPSLVRLGLASLPASKQLAKRELQSLLSPGHFSTGEATATAQWVPVPPQQTPEPAAADLSVWPAATVAMVAENVWKRGRTPVKCLAVIPETHDVKTFVFAALNPLLFSYKPGQFMTLELPIDGKTVRRSYTISSSPSRPHTVSITVKRVPGGLVSNWLHEHMHADFELTVSGPHGDFTCFDAPAQKLLLIAAGSGVTPVMSMLRWLSDTASPADVVFINNIRTPADVIFQQELGYLGTRFGNKLKMGLIPGNVNPGESWNGPLCRFSEQVVRMWAPDFAEREVFVCGPSGYMDMVRTTLEQMGHPAHHYHQESFGAPVAKAGANAPAAPTASERPAPAAALAPAAQVPAAKVAAAAAVPAKEKVELVFSLSAKTVVCNSDDFILDIADEHGIAIPSSCRAGSCGTCKTRKIEGRVEMDGQAALSEGDVNDGFVLACVGRAQGARVVLDA